MQQANNHTQIITYDTLNSLDYRIRLILLHSRKAAAAALIKCVWEMID